MFSLLIGTWSGNAATVLSGRWGAIAQRARDVGWSREAMYQQAQRVEQAVAWEQAGGPSRAALLAEHQRLHDDNRALWEVLDEAGTLSQTLHQQCAATAAAMGLSLTQIVRLLALLLPQRGVPSRATVGRWVEHARRRARGILAVVDQVWQTWVLTLGLEESFFHQEPVFVAVEPHSMAWVAGQRGPDRTGESWGQLRRQWPGLPRVVSDAGTGLARGVKLFNEACAADLEPGQAPVAPVQGGLDVCHTEREMQRVVSRRWAQVEKLMDTAAQAEQRVAHAKQRGIDARGAAGRARGAWGKAERACDEAVQVDTAVEGIRAALAWVRPDGQLNDRAWAQAQITAALGALVGDAWGTVRRLLDDARTLNHLDWMHAQLEQAV
jgi:hypothetical protein